jgi:hypothetical protein
MLTSVIEVKFVLIEKEYPFKNSIEDKVLVILNDSIGRE